MVNSKTYFDQCLKTTQELWQVQFAKEYDGQSPHLESKELFIQRKVDEALEGLHNFNSLAAKGAAAFHARNPDILQKLKNLDTLEVDLEHPPSPQEFLALSGSDMETLSNLASEALDEKKYTDSLGMFIFLVILEPHNFEFFLGAALSCFFAGDIQEAEKYYAMALNTGPKSAKTHLYAADFYFCQGQKGKARDHLEQAICYLEPDDPLRDDADLLKIKFRS